MEDETKAPEGAAEDDVSQYPKYWLPDKAYKALKWTCLVGIPAVAVGYQILAGIWGWPYLDEVPQTLSGVSLVMGVLIGVSEIKGK